MRLFDVVGRFLGRVEVVFAGADEMLREGEVALAGGDAMRARSMARRMLERVPGSPLGLALLADACEAAGLEAELADTLEQLAARLGSNADIWLRVGNARAATDAPAERARDAYLRALALAEPGTDARRGALVALSASDLARGDAMRALAWLDRLEGDSSPEVAFAKAETLLSLGHLRAAREALATAPDDPTDARAAMIRGRILAAARDEAAFAPILRAYILEAAGASELLSSALAWIPTNAETCERVRIAVDGRDEAHLARWRAAFARSRGGKDEARAALREALGAGDATAARPLLDAAIDDADDASLTVALAALPPGGDDELVRAARALACVRAELGAAKGPPAEVSFGSWLDALAALSEPRLAPWVDRTRRTILGLALPKEGPAAWSLLLGRLGAHARAAHDLEASAKLTEVSSERRRPLRLAIVGEFNAGKSTFINALIGADVAPTGVLPTTATLHRLHYAPDPIARVVFEQGHEPPERLLPSLDNLRAALKALENEPIERVEIGIPLQALTRVEVLDTPGFNAPDPRHTQAARRAFDQSDVVLWLFDATQPLKQTERAILDEVRGAGIPIQILINKADRLAPADLEKVMSSTTASLAELGLQSWSPPLAFSARAALAAKLGDQAAKDTSRWSDVLTMFETEIVARADALKERALRRRARAAVHMLRLHVQSLVDAEAQVAEMTAERAHRFAAAAAALERTANDAVDALALALAPPIEAWRADVSMVVIGRDAAATSASASADRYRAERLLAHLAQPLSVALAGLADGTGLAPADLLPTARAMVRPFGFFAGPAAQTDALAGPLARASISTMVELLLGKSTVAALPRAEEGRARELTLLEQALA